MASSDVSSSAATVARRECDRCHESIPVSTDWCPICGNYLGWNTYAEDDTNADAAPTRPRLRITVRPPSDIGPDQPLTEVYAEAGGQTSMELLVRNEGETVGNYTMSVDGLPDSWLTVTPQLVCLNPWGKGEPYEATITVLFHPPRAAQSTARRWPLRLIVHERPRADETGPTAEGVHAGTIDAGLTVGRFVDVAAQLEPTRLAGRRSGHAMVVLRNRGNDTTRVELGASDAAAACDFIFDDATPTVRADGRRDMAMTVRAKRRPWFGTAITHRLEVIVSAAGHTTDPQKLQAVFVQQPLFPRPWGRVLAALAAVVIAGGVAIAATSGPSPSPTPDPLTTPSTAGGLPEETATPEDTATPEETSTPEDTATPEETSTPEDTKSGDGAVSAADVDDICQQAYDEYNDLPFAETTDEIVAVQVETNRILHAAADDLSSLGATDLGDAFETYASAGDDLALAYEQGDAAAVSEAGDAASTAGDDAEALANEYGATACVDLAGI